MTRKPDNVEIASIYGFHTKQGLVELTVNEHKVQMDLPKAREILEMLTGAIEAALSDQLLVQFLTERVGMTHEVAARALLDFREMRQGTRGTARPS